MVVITNEDFGYRLSPFKSPREAAEHLVTSLGVCAVGEISYPDTAAG
jgi:hypothetical protein